MAWERVTWGDPRSLGNTRVDAGTGTGTEGAGGENGILLLDMVSCLVFETLESSQISSRIYWLQ